MEMNIDPEGRVLVKTTVEEISPKHIVSTSVYDDRTEIKFIQKADKVSVTSNKQLVV